MDAVNGRQFERWRAYTYHRLPRRWRHLDKIVVTTSATAANGTGSPATNCPQAAASAQRIDIIPEQNTANNKIILYPNPVTNKLNINLGNNNGIRRIQVMDIAGRTVKDIVVNNGNISICYR